MSVGRIVMELLGFRKMNELETLINVARARLEVEEPRSVERAKRCDRGDTNNDR